MHQNQSHHIAIIATALLFIGTLLINVAQAVADHDYSQYSEYSDIEEMIAADTPPEGIVFVIYEYNEDSLEELIPRLNHYVPMLKEHYKDLHIAVVSHGDEIFALTSELESLYTGLHVDIRNLIKDHNLSFHICGAFAAMNDLSPEDFPDYIDVVPYGPIQISDYREMGYKVLELALEY